MVLLSVRRSSTISSQQAALANLIEVYNKADAPIGHAQFDGQRKKRRMSAEAKNVTEPQRKAIPARIGNALGLCFMALAGIVGITLGMLSVFSTSFFKIDGPSSGVSPDLPSITEELIFKYGLPSLQFIVGFLVLMAGILMLAVVTRAIPTHRIGQFVTVFALTASLVWVLSLNSCGNFWYNDSRSLSDSASAFLEGDYALFDPSAPAHGEGSPEFHVYYSWYPFQTGAMLWFVLVYAITGAGNVAGFQIINALLSAGIAWAIWKISSRCGLNDFALRCEAVLLVLCVPLFTSASFVYPNTAGLFLILIALLLGIHSLQAADIRRTIALAVAAYLIAAIAMMVKGTVIIFVIAFTLTLVVAALIRRQYWLIPLGCVLFIAVHSLSSLSVTIVETATGQDFGDGLPQLSWIAMGLDADSTAKNPGWWTDSAIRAYQQTHGDPVEQSAIAKQGILDSLSAFLQDPGAAFEFFRDKLVSEWSEPTFATFHYAHLTETQDPGPIATTLFGAAYDTTISFENVYQSIIYIFASIGLIAGVARWRGTNDDTRIGMTLLALCLLGGFGCFLLWEAKSVYTLPFFLMLIPLAASGLHEASILFRSLFARLSEVLQSPKRSAKNTTTTVR